MRQLCGALLCLPFGTTVLAQPAQPGAITGAVIAQATGAAVAGALVRIEGANLTATTSGTGRFTIENAPSGPVTLTVEAAGFLPQRVTNVRRDGGNLAIELDATPNFMDRVQVTATKVPLSVGDVAGQADVVDRATIEYTRELAPWARFYYSEGDSELASPGSPPQILLSTAIAFR